MTSIVRESTISTAAREIEILRSSAEEHAGAVFLRVPCQHGAHEGVHTLALDRSDLLAAMRREFGLVDPLEELWDAS